MKIKAPMWKNRVILDESHAGDLESRAAIHQFTNKMDSEAADEAAHSDYKKDHHRQAAAKHFVGMKAARASADNEESRKHFIMFNLHMKALGLNPNAALPSEIETHITNTKEPFYRFSPHKADAFLFAKSEIDGYEVLTKRSKNVRNQTRNLTPEQISNRLQPLKSKLGIVEIPSARSKPALSLAGKTAIYTTTGNVDGVKLPLLHEVGHLLAAPPGRKFADHQKWMGDPHDYKAGDHELAGDRHERAATKIDIGLGRRHGISPDEDLAFQMKPVSRKGIQTDANTGRPIKTFTSADKLASKRLEDFDNNRLDLSQGHLAIKRSPILKRVKKSEEFAKAELHSDINNFMAGLKTLPKGSAERGNYITQHMSHGPFISALQAHPQGKQIHTMLTGFLNSKQNAGTGSLKVTVR